MGRCCEDSAKKALSCFSRVSSRWPGATRVVGLLAACLIADPAVTPRLSAADCNRNGIEDAAELAPGQPAFAADGRIDLSATPIELVAADFDGDGGVDLIGVLADGSLSVLRIEEDGSFREQGIATAQPVRFRALVDLDQDGDLDQVGIGESSGEVLLLENRGDGSFAGAGSLSVAPWIPSPVVAGDFDGDGKQDLAVGAADPLLPPRLPPRVVLFLQKGGLELEKLGDLALDIGLWSIGILAAADLDSDADLDLVAGTPVGVQAVWNDGRGALAPGPVSSACPYADRLESRDFDLDGDLDLACVGDFRLSLTLEQAPGVFGPQKNFLVGQAPAGLVAADLDGDGDPDLATTAFTEHDSVVMLENAGGEPRISQRVRADVRSPGALASVDLDRDGDLDLVAAGRDKRLTILQNRPAAMSLDCDSNGVPDECEVEEPGACRDCNRNGVPDERDLELGVSQDTDSNGVPDECEILEPFTLGFQAPAVVRARAGSIARFDAEVLLHQTAPELGVVGWVVTVGADGATIVAATTRGTRAAPWPEGLRKEGFSRTGRFREPASACGAQAVSSIVLSLKEDVRLDPSKSPHDLLRLTLEAGVPRAEAAALRLWYLDVCNGGQAIHPEDEGRGSGGTGLDTQVTAWDGAGFRSYEPHKLETTILLVPVAVSFRRGDANADGRVDISDPIRILTRLFLGAPAPPCDSAADATDDGIIDISDAVRVLDDFFLHGSTIPPPGPYACGEDPTPDALECVAYEPCG